jgi:hypothetical protein
MTHAHERCPYETVTSADGTSIAYETFGQDSPLIAVCGATCDRALMPLWSPVVATGGNQRQVTRSHEPQK